MKLTSVSLITSTCWPLQLDPHCLLRVPEFTRGRIHGDEVTSSHRVMLGSALLLLNSGPSQVSLKQWPSCCASAPCSHEAKTPLIVLCFHTVNPVNGNDNISRPSLTHYRPLTLCWISRFPCELPYFVNINFLNAMNEIICYLIMWDKWNFYSIGF
jgi:hypothetical protein